MNVGIDFLEFRPSEIAAAVAISVSGEVQAVEIDKAVPYFTQVEKVKRAKKKKQSSVVPTEESPKI